jgi:hypothetical protein
MKKKLFIFRFGSALPLPKEFPLIDVITGGSKRATGCSTPFGVLSIVDTNLSPAEIVQLFEGVAEESGDALPVIVFEESEKVAFHFHSFFFEQFKECNDAFDQEFGTTHRCTLSLDELLDLVKKKGLENLTDVELTRLKELSR